MGCSFGEASSLETRIPGEPRPHRGSAAALELPLTPRPLNPTIPFKSPRKENILVCAKFGMAKSCAGKILVPIPVTGKLVQKYQMVAQQAQTDGRCYFLWASCWLLILSGGSGCLLLFPEALFCLTPAARPVQEQWV